MAIQLQRNRHKGYKQLVDILVNRDDDTCEEAKDRVNEVINLIRLKPYSYEEILADNLGLEPDYLDNILDFVIGFKGWQYRCTCEETGETTELKPSINEAVLALSNFDHDFNLEVIDELGNVVENLRSVDINLNL